MADLFKNGPTPFLHPVTGRLVGADEWYEGPAHVESEPLKDKKELAGIHKEEAKRQAELDKQAKADDEAKKKAEEEAETKRQADLKEAEERARALAEQQEREAAKQTGGAGDN